MTVQRLTVWLSALLAVSAFMLLGRPVQAQNPYTQPGLFLNYGFSVNSMTNAQIETVVEWLQVRGIQKQFLNVGAFNSNGTLSASNYTQLAHWITVSRETEPGQQIIVYISGTLSNVNSSAKDWQNIANVCQTFLTTYGVDGVNLDFEPYSTSASNYIGMLTTIRNTIGWTANLSLDYTADSSAFWSGNDFNTISGYINYIMLMIYDSGSTTVAQYDSFIATAMEYAYNWKVHGCAIVPIVPVYASSSVHNPSIENIETSTNEIWYLTQTDPTVEINDIAVWWYDGWNGSNIGNNSMSAPTDAMWTTYWLDR